MKKILTLALATMVSTSAFAADKVQGSGPNPFTECGIGAAVFADTAWAAATSNVTWDLGSTAVTSAVFSPEMCNAKKVKTAKLIIETLPQLEKDLVVGHGEHLAALKGTVGCDGDFTSALRQNYATVVSESSYSAGTKVERATDMYNAVKGAAASTSCNITL
jgi:hypothetical protein